MLNKFIYIIIGILLGAGCCIIFLNVDFLDISSNIWEFINAIILLITALVVVIYTKETHLLRKHTANQSRPLLYWISDIMNQKKNPVIKEHPGYNEKSPPFILIDIKNFGEEKALIKEIRAVHYYLSFLRYKKLKLSKCPPLFQKDESDKITLLYIGDFDSFPSMKEYQNKYPVTTTRDMPFVYGTNTKEYEKSKKIISAPVNLTFKVKIIYQNLAGTKYETIVRVKNRELS